MRLIMTVKMMTTTAAVATATTTTTTTKTSTIIKLHSYSLLLFWVGILGLFSTYKTFVYYSIIS